MADVRALLIEAADWMRNFQRLMSPRNLSDYGLSLHTKDAEAIEARLRAAVEAEAPQPEMEPCGWVCWQYGIWQMPEFQHPTCPGPHIQVFRIKEAK